MKVPVMDKCCFCATVRTGTLIIASLGMVLGVIMIIVVSMIDDARPFVHNAITDRTAAKVALLIGFVGQLIISALLFIGTYNKNTALMLPWMVVVPAGLIINTVSMIITTILLFVAGHLGAAFATFFIGFIGCAFGLYNLLVAYTYYRELQDEKRNGQLHSTNWEP